MHGPGVDEPLVWYPPTGRRFLIPDERGSIVAVTDAAPETAPTINRYDAYGVPDAGNTGRFQYTGQMWIPELALYHYKARVYHPRLGRFLQTDPIRYGDGMNLYAYCGNNPLSCVDPLGTESYCGGTCYGQAMTPSRDAAFLMMLRASPDLINLGGMLYPPARPVTGPASGVMRPFVDGIQMEAPQAARLEGPNNVVYRALRSGEDPSAGLSARAPGAGNSEMSHVAGKRESQWISTSRSEDVARSIDANGDQAGVVAIDLNKVDSQISDISNGFPDQPGMLSNWARSSQEVLVKDEIPPEAIELLRR